MQLSLKRKTTMDEIRMDLEVGRLTLAVPYFNSADSRVKERFRDIPNGFVKKGCLYVKSLWLEAPVGDSWLAAFRVLVQKGRPIIAEVRVFPDEKINLRDKGEWSASMLGVDAKAPDGGITAPLIRDIRLGIVRTQMTGILEW